jgi:hypothetical protein
MLRAELERDMSREERPGRDGIETLGRLIDREERFGMARLGMEGR